MPRRLPSRTALFALLEPALADAAEHGATLGLLVLRVRRLLETGRLLGYDTGDALVDAVEAVLAGALREGDAAWRLGDDEFAVVLPNLRSREHASLAAAKLTRALAHPLRAGEHSVVPLVNIGAATAPDDATGAQALYRCADQACDDAGTGEERHAFFSAPAHAYDFDPAELAEALAGNRLELHLQRVLPLVQAPDPLRRFEALARWQHPRLGPIPPDVFVRVAEQTGQISEFTRWTLNVGLRLAAEAAREGHPFVVSINLAVEALRVPGFTEQVIDLLGLWGVPPARLTLEITESGLMTDVERSGEALARLRAAGIGVAIDDFGTGYASMAYLRSLPANELKIDQSFVRDMLVDPRARRLVGSMIDVSHHLGMTVVAEGVEDAATLELLRAMGCDHAQGYHVSRPMPASDALQSAVQATVPQA